MRVAPSGQRKIGLALPVLLLALLMLPVRPAVAEGAGDFRPPVVEDLMTLTRDNLIYKGKKVPVPFTRKKLIEVFGKPSREIYNPAGTVVIWDELGLTCYGCHAQADEPEEFQFMSPEEKKTYQRQPYINSITIFIRKYNPYPDQEKKYSHEPHRPFPGKLLVSGVELDGSVTFAEFLERRKGQQTILLPENAFSFYINCKPSPHEITLHTIRNKYDDDFMSIYSVSVRNIAHFYRYYPCVEVFDANTNANKVKKSITEEPRKPPPGANNASESTGGSAANDKPGNKAVAGPQTATPPRPVDEELFGPPSGPEPAADTPQADADTPKPQ